MSLSCAPHVMVVAGQSGEKAGGFAMVYNVHSGAHLLIPHSSYLLHSVVYRLSGLRGACRPPRQILCTEELRNLSLVCSRLATRTFAFMRNFRGGSGA